MDITTDEIFKALEAFHFLESDSSILSKRDILRQNKDNRAFRQLLRATYDPSLVYYIKKMPDLYQNDSLSFLSENYESFCKLLLKLARRECTGNLALDQIQEVFSQMSTVEQIWYTRVLQKDLNVGVKTTLINQEIPGLIPTFSVQLAKDWDGSIPNSVIVQPKLDGYRCVASTTTGKLLSRNGKVIEGYDDLEEQVRQLPSGFKLDGEIMSVDFKGTQTQAFRKSSGKQGVLNVFDIIPEDMESSSTSQLDRTRQLNRFLNPYLETLDLIKPVNSWFLTDPKIDGIKPDIERVYALCLQEGYEGIMLKDPSAPYDPKRSRRWQKFKPVNSIDLKVVDIEPGDKDTKYEFMTGKIIVEFEGNRVGVGSGLSDTQRLAWWNDPTLIVGKTIEILYQEQTDNQKNTRSLRFPRFKCIRFDK